MENERIKQLRVTRTVGREEQETQEASAKDRVGRTMVHTAICIGVLCAALVLRSLDMPLASKLQQGVATALSFDIDAEETLGRLKFVQLQLEDTVTAFAAQSVGEGQTKCMPVQGAVLREFSDEQDHLLLNVQSSQAVVCPARGTVADATDHSIAIDFADGTSCLIDDLGYIRVQQGDSVTCGQTIAVSDVNGTPISFYVWQNGMAIDPVAWVGQ